MQATRLLPVLGLLLGVVSVDAQIKYSLVPSRAGGVLLDTSTVGGSIYVYFDTAVMLNRVEFFIDGASVKVEGLAPWDLQGGSDEAAVPYDTASLSNGAHTMRVVTNAPGVPPATFNAAFTVNNAKKLVVGTADDVTITVNGDGMASADVSVSMSDASAVTVDITGSAAWATVSATQVSTTSSVTVTVDSTMRTGQHTFALTFTPTDTTIAPVVKNIVMNVVRGVSIVYSTSPSRTNPMPLQGSTPSGNVYIFTTPDNSNIAQVIFSLDGTVVKTEGMAPYDLQGGAVDKANPYDVTPLSDGQHTLEATVKLTDGTMMIVPATFTIASMMKRLVVGTGGDVTLTVNGDGMASADVSVSMNDASAVTVDITGSPTWATLSATQVSTTSSVTVTVDSTMRIAGQHTFTLTFTPTDTTIAPVTQTVVMTVIRTVNHGISFVYSKSPNRANPMPLEGSALQGTVYIHTTPDLDEIDEMQIYLNNAFVRREGTAPYDLQGGAVDRANPYDTTTVTDGSYTVRADVTFKDGSTASIQAMFMIGNNAPMLVVSKTSFNLEVFEGATTPAESLTVTTSTGGAAAVTVVADPATPWLTVSKAAGNTPLTLTVSPTTRPVGTHTSTITVATNDPAFFNSAVTIPFTLVVKKVELEVSQGDITLNLNVGETGSKQVAVKMSDNSQVSVGVASNAAWATPSVTNFQTPESVTVAVDATALTPGTHEAIITFSPAGHAAVTRKVVVGVASSMLQAGNGDIIIKVDGDGTASSVIPIRMSDGSSKVVNVALGTASWAKLDKTQVTTSSSVRVTVDSNNRAAGQYTVPLTFTPADSSLAAVTRNVVMQVNRGVFLAFSRKDNRAGSLPVDGSTVGGVIFVHVPNPMLNIDQVHFSLDGTFVRREGTAPFDFQGGEEDEANPFDTTTLSDGMHTMTIRVQFKDGTPFTTMQSAFLVDNAAPRLVGDVNVFTESIMTDDSVRRSLRVTTTSGQTDITVESDSSWLVATKQSRPTPNTITLQTDRNLGAGTYTATVLVRATNPAFTGSPLALTFSLTVVAPAVELPEGDIVFGLDLPGDKTTRTLDVKMNDNSKLPVNVAISGAGSSWVKASVNSLTTPASLTLSIDSAGLTAGKYEAMLSLDPTGPIPATTRRILLGVSRKLDVGTGDIVFTITGSKQESQTISLAMTDFSAVDVALALQWEAGWADISKDRATTPSSVTVSAKSNGLKNGVYATTLLITSQDPTVAPATRDVVINVKGMAESQVCSFMDENDQIVMEAENADVVLDWVRQSNGISGDAMVDNGLRHVGHMDYNVCFRKPGRWYLWGLIKNGPFGSESNDCFVYLDGERTWDPQGLRPDGLKERHTRYVWGSEPKGPGSHTTAIAPLHVRVGVPGSHVFSIFTRAHDKGFGIDKLVLRHESRADAQLDNFRGGGPPETKYQSP